MFFSSEFVMARNRFHDAGLAASVGRYAFGFTWGAWACLTLATIMLFLGCGLGGRKEQTATTTRAERSGRGSNLMFFRRQRSRGARGSLSESQRRVKDEYA